MNHRPSSSRARQLAAAVACSGLAVLLAACSGTTATTATPTPSASVTAPSTAVPAVTMRRATGEVTSPASSSSPVVIVVPPDRASATTTAPIPTIIAPTPLPGVPAPKPIATPTVIDPAAAARSDPVRLAAAFVTAYQDRKAIDSQADNYAQRAQALVTPRLLTLLIAQAAQNGASLGPAAGSTRVTIATSTPVSRANGKTLTVMVTYTMATVVRGITISDVDGFGLRISLVRQTDGRWLVDGVAAGPN